jgi:hypothetical protein
MTARERMRSASRLGLPHVWLMVVVGGCIALPAPEPEPVVIEFVNQTSLDVRPNFCASETATDAAGLFIGANLDTSFTDRPFPELRPGESASTTRACGVVSSLGVSRPVLFDAATLTVTTWEDQILLLRDAEFTCGATIRFVFFTEGDAFRVRVEYPQ